jgi:hypothetical protein
MLMTGFRQTRDGELRHRVRSCRELATSGEIGPRDLGWPRNCTTNESGNGDHRRRMFANSVAAGLAGTPMTSAYFVFNHLGVMS